MVEQPLRVPPVDATPAEAEAVTEEEEVEDLAAVMPQDEGAGAPPAHPRFSRATPTG